MDGSFIWSDGTPLTFTNWNYGEPNSYDGFENCVEMSTYSSMTLRIFWF